MQRALTLADESVGLASPNPRVGCVLMRDGGVLGEGAHLYDGRDHAEIVALKQAAAAGHDTRGATAYVTLEPCSHHGRTGPCADALIAAGVARVVAATVDPNPEVSGRGIARLRAAGVGVDVGLLQAQARALNDTFAVWITERRPHITLKAALSVDGYLAPPTALRTANETFWLTGAEARAEVHRMRHAADAILCGIGTVLADDPLLTDRSGRPRRRPLLRLVFDSDLRIPLASRLVQSAQEDLWVFCAERALREQPETAAALEERGVRVLALPGEAGLDPRAMLPHLRDAAITSLLLEAGTAINGAFLAAELVDRVVLFYAETELGPDAAPFARTTNGIVSPFALERRLLHVTRRKFGGDVCVRGALHDPWASLA